jgi:CBS domain-containing protein
LVGIFTERDLMRRVVLKGRDVSTTGVSEVMTRELLFSEPDKPGEEAMSKMTRHRCRHLPVVDGERLVGVISIGDLMKEISDEQSVEIHFLKEYIYSR